VTFERFRLTKNKFAIVPPISPNDGTWHGFSPDFSGKMREHPVYFTPPLMVTMPFPSALLARVIRPRAQKRRPDRVRLALFRPEAGATITLANLDKNLPLSFSEPLTAERLLMLWAKSPLSTSQRILNHVQDAIFQKNTVLHRLDVKPLKAAFQTHLAMERCFFEEPAADCETSYHGMLLEGDVVYPLHTEGLERCFVIRDNRLLTFDLLPHQFIRLEQEDILLLADGPDVEKLHLHKALKPLAKQFMASPFKSPVNSRAGQKLTKILGNPLLALSLAPLPVAMVPLDGQSKSTPKLTRLQMMWLGFVLMWIVALAIRAVLPN